MPVALAFLARYSDLKVLGTGVDEKRVGLREVLTQLERDSSQSKDVGFEFDVLSISTRGEVVYEAEQTEPFARTPFAGRHDPAIEAASHAC